MAISVTAAIALCVGALLLLRVSPLRDWLPASLRPSPPKPAAAAALEAATAPQAANAAAAGPGTVSRDAQHSAGNANAPDADAFPGATTSTTKLGRARGFRDALTKAGCSPAEGASLVNALGKLVDFRRVRGDDDLILARNDRGELVGFEYRASPIERVRAERNAAGTFTAARVNVNRELRRSVKGGYINDSLAKALEGVGLRASLVGAFVEAFEGRIDFRRQMRPGDAFKVIEEDEFVDGQPTGGGKVYALEYRGQQTGPASAFWFESSPRGGDFYDEHGRGMHGGWLRTPLRYNHISSRFNLHRRHPILHKIVPHLGIDYAAAAGTTVWAAGDGVVTFVGRRGPSGNLVAMRHSGGYESFYAHLSRPAVGLHAGRVVRQRQPVGTVGSTGRSTGPHLHFALKHGGQFVDPATQLNGPGKVLPPALQAKFNQAIAPLKRELATIELAAAPAEGAPEPADSEAEEDFHEESLDL